MSPQSSIAHYRITSKLGQGGMGEVWRATDTKLNREVAIKILPEAFARDTGRLERFTREAQVLASLNHPNIAAIYGVENQALVMELVEGTTLAERIAQGPIPVAEALPIARQIADALEYAHDRGVIHRDLKPANIKITPEGRAKVLDFGLAKALSSDTAAGDPTVSPTLTMGTNVGTIMGTAAYMSPEQARGQAVDRRTDIWAFGVVLYEMLTMRQLFAAPTISDTLVCVLKGEIDLTAVPDDIRPTVERCLRRDPRLRWRSIGDVFALLEEGAPAASSAVAHRSRFWWAAIAVIAAVAAAGWLLLWRATRPVEHPLMRLSVDLGPEAVPDLDLTAVISPDGRRLVFPARGPDGKLQLATRVLDQSQPTMLPGTEGGHQPFFSPDGQSVGFFSTTQLKKVPVQGGAPMTLGVTTTSASAGGSWGEDGNIVIAPSNLDSLWILPATGGARRRLTKLAAGETTHRWPQVLPGAKAVLYTASRSANGMLGAEIRALSLKTGQVKTVQPDGYYGRYVPGGFLLYLQQGVLFGVRFDPGTLEVRGSPTRLLEDVAANSVTGGGEFDFSNTGVFVYTSGKSMAQAWKLVWLDSSGATRPLIGATGAHSYPRFSPDGRRLAFTDNGADLYVYDLQRDTPTRLTFRGDAQLATWTSDSQHLAYVSGSALVWMRADGAGAAQKLLDNPSRPRPWSFSPDGRVLAYHESGPETGFDIWTLPLDLTDPEHPKAGKPELFLRTPADELVPRFSPDGRWIAYRSNESGINEIYVRPFPASVAGKWQISTGGGLYAFWSTNGQELFYETEDRQIMVVNYSVEGASFVLGKPRTWYEKQLFYNGTSNLDLAPDGKRFVVFSLPLTAPENRGSVHVTMLLNFFDDLQRKVPLR
jgi:serine/threonine-protein kinase